MITTVDVASTTWSDKLSHFRHRRKKSDIFFSFTKMRELIANIDRTFDQTLCALNVDCYRQNGFRILFFRKEKEKRYLHLEQNVKIAWMIWTDVC